MRVLIADDQKAVGLSLAALVERCGHEVIEIVSSGLDAIHAYSKSQPDVVLMDYLMPRLNGATACRMIRAKYPAARIILVTGMVQTKAMTESGAVIILPKPVDLERLYAALYDAAKPPPA